jgi:hypothetical protein
MLTEQEQIDFMAACNDIVENSQFDTMSDHDLAQLAKEKLWPIGTHSRSEAMDAMSDKWDAMSQEDRDKHHAEYMNKLKTMTYE